MTVVWKALLIRHNRWPRFEVEIPYGFRLRRDR